MGPRMNWTMQMSLARYSGESRVGMEVWGLGRKDSASDGQKASFKTVRGACDGSSQHQQTHGKEEISVRGMAPIRLACEHFLLIAIGGPVSLRVVPSLNVWAWTVRERSLS